VSESLLAFAHQDGRLVFPVKRAVYCLTPDGQFSCSIECEANPAHAFMSQPCFCFMRCPVGRSSLSPGTVLRIDHRQGERDDFALPSTHLYAGSHFDPWAATVEVLALEAGAAKVAINFMTDDPNYYGALAKSTPCSCTVWLQQVSVDQVRDLM
jgi:hypothetical protein